jgi:Ca2+-dependent lipid-binding protein
MHPVPKVDWGTGKVDAFVEVEFEDRMEKTQVVMKDYDPVFNDSFV